MQGLTHAGRCATRVGLFPTWVNDWRTRGRLLAPVCTPSVVTRFAEEPDSATTKKTLPVVGENTLSRPSGPSKPVRSPTRLSGRLGTAVPGVQAGPAT